MTASRSAAARAAMPWVRIGLGVTAQLFPRLLYVPAAIRAQENADAAFIMRAFGTRALALGAMSTGLAGENAARTTMRMGAVVDLLDVGTLWLSYRRGTLGRAPLVLNTLGGILFFAPLGFVGSLDVQD